MGRNGAATGAKGTPAEPVPATLTRETNWLKRYTPPTATTAAATADRVASAKIGEHFLAIEKANQNIVTLGWKCNRRRE